jgi:peptidoglycan/xylan/chitin deacetylase (PgdA/CDA1 family)
VKRIRQLGADSRFILMYHRITNPRTEPVYIQPGMYVTPETFAMHLKALQSETIVLPLHELLNRMRQGNGNPASKPLCAITFDDGWLDFCTNAFPVLKSLNMPATVFLPTNFIGTDKWFWTDQFAFVWKQLEPRRRPAATAALRSLSRIQGSFESQIEKAVAVLKNLPGNAIEDVLAELEKCAGTSSRVPGRAFLNWEEVREMRGSGLVSFGSHTAGHQILTTLDQNGIRDELLVSKQKLVEEKAADADGLSFCYPNGNFNQTISALVKESGYSSAVTTKTGWNSFSENHFALKRIGMHQDMTSTKSLFLSRLAGIF